MSKESTFMVVILGVSILILFGAVQELNETIEAQSETIELLEAKVDAQRCLIDFASVDESD